VSNTKFLADARVLGRGSSVWIVSVLGGVPHKVRDDAEATSASPDGALIAFARNKGTVGYREIWVMDSSGLKARKLFETDANSDFQSIRWSPDGRRLVYRKDYAVGSKLETTVESRELNGGPPTIILSNPMVWTFAWLPGGRFIYSLTVREINVANSNLWELQVDPQNGEPSGKPVRLTNWSGFCIAHPSATADGKQ
jgi:Tol biopolymer transport system component